MLRFTTLFNGRIDPFNLIMIMLRMNSTATTRSKIMLFGCMMGLLEGRTRTTILRRERMIVNFRGLGLRIDGSIRSNFGEDRTITRIMFLAIGFGDFTIRDIEPLVRIRNSDFAISFRDRFGYNDVRPDDIMDIFKIGMRINRKRKVRDETKPTTRGNVDGAFSSLIEPFITMEDELGRLGLTIRTYTLDGFLGLFIRMIGNLNRRIEIEEGTMLGSCDLIKGTITIIVNSRTFYGAFNRYGIRRFDDLGKIVANSKDDDFVGKFRDIGICEMRNTGDLLDLINISMLDANFEIVSMINASSAMAT